MANVMQLLPEVPPGEQAAISGIVSNLSEDSEQMFAMAYRSQRKDETTILLFTLIGLVLIAGVQRFVIGHIGLGVLYLLTAGLCFIGTIVDAINHKKLANEHNVKIANQIAMNLSSGA